MADIKILSDPMFIDTVAEVSSKYEGIPVTVHNLAMMMAELHEVMEAHPELWRCQYCGTLHGDEELGCDSCGAPRSMYK